LTLVIDASLAVEACIAPGGFQALADQTLVAPAIMWSEVRSVLHERRWRGDLTQQQAIDARAVLIDAPIARVEDDRIQREAWHIADAFGWAKTYDAEYVGLAQILGCRLLTIDGRLRRGAARLDIVITPAEL
jgi:predicted nucleic acid-binding protein